MVTFVVSFVAAISGLAAASAFSGTPSPGPSTATTHRTIGKTDDAADRETEAVHGGPIERFHESGSCDLTSVRSLPGNWTHGDCVSAVAAGGDAAQIQQAAHSDCGKPMVAVGHGGPPAFAEQHAADGKAHANDRHILNGKPDDAGETASG